MDIKKLYHLHLNLIGWQLIAIVILVPLVLWPKTSEVFEFNKMLTTYLLTGTTLLTFLSLCTLSRKNLFKRTPLDLPILLFLLSQLISTIVSIHPATSIWGYYSRFHGGLLSYLTYTAIFYLFVAYSHLLPKEKAPGYFDKTRFLNHFLQALTLTGGLVAFYGILERFGIDKHIWIQDVQNRVFSTLGQPNWLSAYLSALLPLTLHLFFNSQSHKQKLYWLTLTLTYLLAILFTKSRSGIGTTFIILTLYTLYSLYHSLKARQQSSVVSLIVFGLSTLIILLSIGTPWTPTPDELQKRLDLGGPLFSELEPYLQKAGLSSQIKPLEIDRLPKETQDLVTQRSQGIRVGGSDSFEIRQIVWQGALDLFRRRPLFGTGVETFGYSYYWTRPKAHNMLSEWDFLYNKAHNEYLNFLATTGIIGFATYLILLLAILKVIHQNRSKNNLVVPSLLGVTAILITNYFGFSVVMIGILLFLFPALSLYPHSDTQVPTLKLEPHSQSTYLKLSLWAFLSLVLVLSLYRIWRADIHYSLGKTYLDLGYVAQSIQDLEKAVALSSAEGNYQASLAEAYATASLALHQKSLSATQSATQNASRTLKSQSDLFQAKAIESIQNALTNNRYHLNFLKSKVKIEIILSDIDKRYLELSLQTLNQAIALAPTDPKLVYNLGLVYEQLGKRDEALQAYQKALDLKPDYQSVKEDLERVTKALQNQLSK